MSEWISVKECAPEKDVKVLVWSPGFFQSKGPVMAVKSHEEDDTIPFGANIWTHWQPLPEPPND